MKLSLRTKLMAVLVLAPMLLLLAGIGTLDAGLQATSCGEGGCVPR